MNGTQSNAGVAAYSDHETDASENESEMGDFKSAQEHPVEETNWSACSDNENNLNLTNESDVSAGALDPLASPGRRKSTSSIADQKSPDSSGSRSDSGSITPDNASPNRSVHRDIGLSNSPTHAKSGSASPNHLADGSANHNSASESPAHKSGSPSPRNSTSPVRSRPSSPEAVRRKDSSPMVAPGSPVNVKSQSASPVNLNSDTEDEKNVGAIDLESDDDCMIVEEDKAKKKDKTPKKEVAQSPKQKASNGKPEPAKEKTVKEEPEPSLRRSLRVTKRKSYIDDSNVDDVSDSEKDTKKPKIAPPVPLITTTISSQFRLINPQTTIKSTFPGSVQSPKIVNPQNGIVAQSMLNSMAQRGVSIVATPVNRPQPTPPQPPAAPKPVKKPAPPPPFPKDSVFAGMTNGQSLIEAPSFLSPLLFVKKPLVSLRKFVDEFGEEVKREQKKREDELEAQRMKEEEARKAREEEERKAMEEEAARKKEEAERLGSSGEAMDEDAEKDGANVVNEEESAKAAEDNAAEPKKKGRRKRKDENDDSWDEDEQDSSSESSDEETPKTVILKEKQDDDEIPKLLITPQTPASSDPASRLAEKSKTYFDSPLGNFFIDIGLNLVQERVHTDLFNMQKRRYRRDNNSETMEDVMQFLSQNIARLKQANMSFNFGRVRCQFCNFKTESALVMANHMEVPHASGAGLRCNFCPFEVIGPALMLSHVSSAHGVAARLVRAPALHQCPECPFESGTKGRYVKHTERCLLLHVPDTLRPQDWQPPAKLIKASARPNYSTYRPRFNPRVPIFPGMTRPFAPPFPHMGIRAPRMKRPNTPVVTCNMCGSRWADSARLRDHVLRDHSVSFQQPTLVIGPDGVLPPQPDEDRKENQNRQICNNTV